MQTVINVVLGVAAIWAVGSFIIWITERRDK